MDPITRDEVLHLVTVEAAVKSAEAVLEKCRADRQAARDTIMPRLPLGEWVELFGVRLRRRAGSTGDKFSLKKMRDAGKKLPKYLLPFVTESRETKLLDLEPAGDQAAELEVLAARVADVAAAA